MNFRVLAIIRKEFIHIFRDPRFLTITIVMPLLMIFILGYAVKLDINEIPLIIVDHNRTADSRELVNKFTNSGYFIIQSRIDDTDEIHDLFKKRKAKAALLIPTDYSEQLKTQLSTQIQIIVDGSNSNTASIIMNYTTMITSSYSQALNLNFVHFPLDIEPRVWYNPDMESVNFVIPGLVAIILMMICALLTSITIAREKETGTMEQILVSPVNPIEIIIGKVIPYVILGFLDGALIVFIGWSWFHVPIHGNVLLLAFLSVFYLYSALSLGVFISTRANSQLIAMMTALVITLLPSLLLSGFLFPISSMPLVLRLISYIVPAKYFLVIIRGIIMKGIGISYFWEQILFLFGLGTILLILSRSGFKTKLE